MGFVIEVGLEMTVIRRASAAIPSIRWNRSESLRRSYTWDLMSVLEILLFPSHALSYFRLLILEKKA